MKGLFDIKKLEDKTSSGSMQVMRNTLKGRKNEKNSDRDVLINHFVVKWLWNY